MIYYGLDIRFSRTVFLLLALSLVEIDMVQGLGGAIGTQLSKLLNLTTDFTRSMRLLQKCIFFFIHARMLHCIILTHFPAGVVADSSTQTDM